MQFGAWESPYLPSGVTIQFLVLTVSVQSSQVISLKHVSYNEQELVRYTLQVVGVNDSKLELHTDLRTSAL